jgi:riboflavin kinase/FMN adenylyltransferase
VTEIVSLPDVTVATLPQRLHGGVASVGNFDGVHRGHASLLGQTRRLADQLGGPAIACLFEPHPIAILRPELAPKRLTTVQERARRMAPLGIDFLVVCTASAELLNLSPEQFFDGLVRNNLQARGMVEGENFCFGKDRKGDVDLLRQLCREAGIEFRIAEMRSENGQMISSSRIRDLLTTGDVATAAEYMGRPHRISGRVDRGDGRGRSIGFPTANLHQVDAVIPAAGVYAAIGSTDDRDYPAAVHIGESPTFQSGDATKVEVHLIDFSGDLYGKAITVQFIRQIRGTMHFNSVDELVHQLKVDLHAATDFLQQHQQRKPS